MYGVPTKIHVKISYRQEADIFSSSVLLGLDCDYTTNRFIDVCETLERFDHSLQLTPSRRWMTIVSSSSDVTRAADETSPIICKLINQDLDGGLKRQLESFLLQLAVRNVEVSAGGCFKINREITILSGDSHSILDLNNE
ncbi:hypothetical protein J6590_072695 [Homalodisca vitripennis]|nr:hypothetical protein J6590_072695 [Homalodisca vitripennis]